MSATTMEHPSITATVLSGHLSVPLPEVQHTASLKITVPDFDLCLSTSLTDFESVLDSTTITANAVLDDRVNVVVLLTGMLVNDGTLFLVKEVSLQIRAAAEQARADFIASTLNALFALAREVQLQIPAIGLDLELRFDLSPLDISKLLQARQTAYRLMVIERSTGAGFLLPLNFSGDDIATITFAYYSIVDRSFNWQFESHALRVPADKENLNRLTELTQPSPISFTLPAEPVIILGRPISLGPAEVTVSDGIIENLTKAKEELSRLDGHAVEVIVRSLSGQARFHLAQSPYLPERAWDSNIQTLIDAESQLDRRLIERYDALAAASLAGLTEEEKSSLTARPDLDLEAFLIEEW